MIVHTLEKFAGNGVTRSCANNRIHGAFGTESSLTIIDPFNNVRRWEDGKAVKAAAKTATLQFASMERTVLVGENIVLTHAANEFIPPALEVVSSLSGDKSTLQ